MQAVPCFNGAALDRARNQDVSRALRRRRACFNGAALDRARNRRTAQSTLVQFRSFNGAALDRARNLDRKTLPEHVTTLYASMEPRSIERGITRRARTRKGATTMLQWS